VELRGREENSGLARRAAGKEVCLDSCLLSPFPLPTRRAGYDKGFMSQKGWLLSALYSAFIRDLTLGLSWPPRQRQYLSSEPTLQPP
jgi:hypothetical protein